MAYYNTDIDEQLVEDLKVTKLITLLQSLIHKNL